MASFFGLEKATHTMYSFSYPSEAQFSIAIAISTACSYYLRILSNSFLKASQDSQDHGYNNSPCAMHAHAMTTKNEWEQHTVMRWPHVPRVHAHYRIVRVVSKEKLVTLEKKMTGNGAIAVTVAWKRTVCTGISI